MRSLMARVAGLLGLVASVSMVVAACGGGSDEATQAPAATARPTAAATTATQAPAAATAVPTARPANTPAPPPTATAVPQPRGQLTLGLATLSSYQGIYYQGGSPHLYQDAYLDPLVGTDANNKDDPARGLINSWTVDTTGTFWTFKTRDGIVFHNGDKASAADAAWWILTVRDSKEIILSSQGQQKTDVKEVLNPDPNTFTVQLNSRNVFWPAVQLAMGGCGGNPCTLYSKKYYETVGLQGYNKNPVGSGPFKPVSFQVGVGITMEAVEKHWFWGTPRVKTMVFQEIPEEGTAVAALKTNQLQFITLSRGFAATVKADANLRLLTRPGGTVNMYIPEVYKKEFPGYGKNPMADVNVRRALVQSAIDRDTLAKKFMAGYAEPTVNWPANQGDPSYEKIPVPPFDVAKAKQLLAEAGYPKGFELDVYIWTPAAQAEGPELMDAISTMWENVGIKVNRKPINQQTWASGVQLPRKYDKPAIAGLYFLGMYRFGANQAAQSANPNGVNYSFDEQPVFDKILAWAQSGSLEEYIKLGKETQKIMVDRVHTTPTLMTFQGLWGARADPNVIPPWFQVTRDNIALGLFRMGLNEKPGY
ncbi:MAG: ABC transporter substrate-binding protein [Dehalococcoidia bacterium]|nr:ABC transporter substrate-binding protein [Dehalococcoidia bacterium]